MRNVDFSPLYRNAIGFDRLLNLMGSEYSEKYFWRLPSVQHRAKDEHNYRITMAVAGFSEDQLDLTQNENMLIVKGERKAEEGKTTCTKALQSAILNVSSN